MIEIRSMSARMGHSSVVGILLAFFCFDLVLADIPNEVRAILDGARGNRLSVREGRMTIAVTDEVFADNWREEFILEVLWKGDSLRFTEVSKNQEKRRCSIRHQGELLYRYAKNEVALDDSSKGYSYFLFDPRILGAYATLTPSLNAFDCLFTSKDDWEYDLLAQSEKIAGRDCLVVRMKRTGIAQDYWIEKQEPFSILKIIDHNNSTETVSSYDGAIFPKSVVVVKSVHDQIPFRKTSFQITESVHEKIELELFTYAGLGLEVGASVTDQPGPSHVGICWFY
jgi:hypothetical protein